MPSAAFESSDCEARVRARVRLRVRVRVARL